MLRQFRDRRTDAPAVTFEDTSLSYAELEDRVDELVGLAHDRGVGPGELVGLCLQRSFDMVASMLAVWSIGAAFVPIDPTLPPGRAAMMIEDAGTDVVIAKPDVWGRVGGGFEVAMVGRAHSSLLDGDSVDQLADRIDARNRRSHPCSLIAIQRCGILRRRQSTSSRHRGLREVPDFSKPTSHGAPLESLGLSSVQPPTRPASSPEEGRTCPNRRCRV